MKWLIIQSLKMGLKSVNPLLYGMTPPCLAVPDAGQVAESVETVAVSIARTSHIQDPVQEN
jgi:hypothetical protein